MVVLVSASEASGCNYIVAITFNFDLVRSVIVSVFIGVFVNILLVKCIEYRVGVG